MDFPSFLIKEFKCTVCLPCQLKFFMKSKFEVFVGVIIANIILNSNDHI